MPSKLLIVFLNDDDTEYIVLADRWEVRDGVLHTWRLGGLGGGDRYDRQAFPICNILRWAVLDN
jgi:hypothetical protein